MLPALLAAAAACAAPPAQVAPDYAALFRQGVPFAEFLANADRRKAEWRENFAAADVPDALLARARAAGAYKLLVIAVDGCSDSVNTIPYMARLAELVPGLELRVVGSDAGRPVMETHRTRDGRAATPTVIVLDSDYQEVGCWIERPDALQSWIQGQKGSMDDNEIFDRKMKWYDEDRGQATLAELVAVLEAAAAGSPRCVG